MAGSTLSRRVMEFFGVALFAATVVAALLPRRAERPAGARPEPEPQPAQLAA